LKVACPEEIAFKLGFITASELEDLARAHGSNGYGQYLRGLLERPAF
jgi:glucose-1-phosphate thymidylyltransferase